MTDIDEAIEAAWKAAFYVRNQGPRTRARALVRALEERGVVLVPGEPTAEMFDASMIPKKPVGIGTVWRYMIDARPRPSCMREPEPGNAEAVFGAAERVHEVAEEEALAEIRERLAVLEAAVLPEKQWTGR